MLAALEHTHLACFEICKKVLGKHLPVAGNIGVFCHYDDEYETLTKIREELTKVSDNWNQKYFRLHKPITFPAKGDVTKITYTYLYIRKPDPYSSQVGDVDFVLEPGKYTELKQSLLGGEDMKGARVFKRPDLDMIELYDPDIDALAYIRTQDMEETLRAE